MAINEISRMSHRLATSLLLPLFVSCGWVDLGGNQAIGRPCDLGVAAGPSQGVINTEGNDCPSQVCVKPVVQQNASGTVDTGPYCSGECSADSDCGGELRDPTNPSDTRCTKGFTCGIAFVKGPLCCKRLCLCKDFLGPEGAPVPIACQGPGAVVCGGADAPLMSTAVTYEQTDAYIDVSPARQLDLAIMVDNSPGMAPKIEKLNAAFPTLIEALEDPVDGTLPDLHVAILDSDLGTGTANTSGPCGPKLLPDGTHSIFGDLGRFQMRASPTACPFNPGALFLEHKAGLPLNYTGDISSVLACLTSNLGTIGCDQEHQLQAFEFALAAKGVGNEAQQDTFLRPNTTLGLIFVTDEDDCSAAINDQLFGDLPGLGAESTSLRCATRSHMCLGQDLTLPPPGYPTTAPFIAPFNACQARVGDECPGETNTAEPTACNPLKSIEILASEVVALRANPNDQLLVAGIFGWPRSDAEMATAEYRIAPIPNPNPADIAHPTVFASWPVCYDPNHLPSPATTDPATGFDATAAAWGATGGLREAAFIDQFGANGMKFSVCEPDFSPMMASIGNALVRKLQNVCVERKLLDTNPYDPGVQADCRVAWRVPKSDFMNPDRVYYEENPYSLPQCVAGSTNGNVAEDCWQLTYDPSQCPGTGQRIGVLRTAQEIAAQPQLPTGTKLGLQCRTCPTLTAGAPAPAGCDY